MSRHREEPQPEDCSVPIGRRPSPPGGGFRVQDGDGHLHGPLETPQGQPLELGAQPLPPAPRPPRQLPPAEGAQGLELRPRFPCPGHGQLRHPGKGARPGFLAGIGHQGHCQRTHGPAHPPLVRPMELSLSLARPRVEGLTQVLEQMDQAAQTEGPLRAPPGAATELVPQRDGGRGSPSRTAPGQVEEAGVEAMAPRRQPARPPPVRRRAALHNGLGAQPTAGAGPLEGQDRDEPVGRAVPCRRPGGSPDQQGRGQKHPCGRCGGRARPSRHGRGGNDGIRT